MRCVLPFTLAGGEQAGRGFRPAQVNDSVLPGPPELQAVGCRPPEGELAHPESERSGQLPAQGGSVEASGSCCDSQPVGPGYVQEVISPSGNCCVPLSISGWTGPRQGQVSCPQPSSPSHIYTPIPGLPSVCHPELAERRRHWVSGLNPGICPDRESNRQPVGAWIGVQPLSHTGRAGFQILEGRPEAGGGISW